MLDVAREFHGWADSRMTAMDVLLESFAISRSLLGRRTPVVGAGQRVVNLPALRMGRHDIRDFSKTELLLAAGREAGRAMIAEERSLTRAFGYWASDKSFVSRVTPSTRSSSPSA